MEVCREVWSASEGSTVHLTFRLSHSSPTAHPRAADVLGTHHPLVCDLERLDVARNQFMVVAGMLAAGVAMLVPHSAPGISLIVAAAIVELVIACRIAVLLESRRLHVLDLIAEGRSELPIPIVARTCAQLRAPRHRQQLVRSIEILLDPRSRQFDPVVTPWQFARSELVRGVRRELNEISLLMRGPDAPVQGIALIERLLTDGTSCLHRDDSQVLREQLGRVRFLLEA
jgi:hypothetical protein